MAGGGGIAATQLSGAISATATTINVDNTTGFLTSDVVTIDSEYIAYSGKTATSFTGATRGYNGSVATTHRNDKYVYTQETSMINQALGYNVASTSSTSGAFTVVALGFVFLGRGLLNLVIWDFPNLWIGQLIYFRIILMAIGGGLVIYICLNYLLPAMGILQRRSQ